MSIKDKVELISNYLDLTEKQTWSNIYISSSGKLYHWCPIEQEANEIEGFIEMDLGYGGNPTVYLFK